MNMRILGTGSYVPERIVTNDDLAQIVETSDEWISTRTGIRERRISQGEGTSFMAAEAAKKALEQSGIKPEELDLILLGTSTPDNCFPSGACEVQGAVGASGAVAFDISAACSGFIFALNTAQAFFESGIYKTALVIGCDVLSKIVDWEDRSTCVLFGDGAGAVVVQAEEGKGFRMVMGSDGSRASSMECPSRTNDNFLTGRKPEAGFTTMDGQEIFRFAVKKVPECAEELLEKNGVDREEIKYFVLHQANYRIVEAIAKRMRLPIERFPMNIDRYGNTSGATIPILLDELNREGKLSRGDKIALAGFGAGLTWGAALLEW
ncbi:MAG TPA: ketoacyl-ACP synthase III [Candidatus Lachnoclostridium stercorigallinarum]|uniref:Beta-ketoacyl-[acyl-carrier-protein] synthase III n=1 Tax=Candidatus Lachnoclostridium stercorigallinarum TaxID=2838634 RepID=A0A9D2GHW4_9FIRM|nr:ketoacyl-ACP synthase III [Candidatus Lachnoclostridium stercorigallinarum]